MSLTRLLILFISVALLGNTLAQASTSEKTRYQFTLQSAQGAVSDTDFAKQHILLTFGYTSCPDICPTILYDLKQVMTMLDHPDKLQVIFISIDPEADTPERLAQYVQFFDKRFIGLTGDYAQLKTLARAYGATFGYRHAGQDIEPPNLPADRTVYHSSLLYLLSPTRELLEVFHHQTPKDAMANVLNRHLNAAE